MTYWKHKEKLLLLIASWVDARRHIPEELCCQGLTQRELTQSFFMLTACSEIISEDRSERPSVIWNNHGDFRAILILRNHLKGHGEAIYSLALHGTSAQLVQENCLEMALHGQEFSISLLPLPLQLQIQIQVFSKCLLNTSSGGGGWEI